ncbi:hypothetical protein HDE79_001101 [Rhodanobacter sp. MP1X3]|nr:hypothetical protein [Rhodanobacter sp. MP1X3]
MTFLLDSIMLAMRAETEYGLEFQNSLSRSALLASTHLLEASANTCIDALALGNGFANDIDRLPFLSKFEIFVQLRFPKRQFDRARHEVQGVSELKQVRDSFVHPKSQKTIWESWSPEGSVSRSPRTKSLGLSKIASYGHPDDAVRALKVSHAFLRYVFKDTCRFSAIRVNSFLCSEDPIPTHTEPVIPYWPRDIHRWLHNHCIDLSYIKIGKV